MLENKRIAIDVDGVICSFTDGVIREAKKQGLEEHFPKSCEDVNCWDICDKFSELMKPLWTDQDWWLQLKPMEHSMPLPFTPVAYITKRFIPSRITERWLNNWYFPKAPVITVTDPKDKLDHVKELQVDAYIDDLYSTVRHMRDEGVNAILLKSPYQVGHVEECKDLPTIKYLDQIVNYI